VAVWRTHHGNLDALIAQASDTSGPFSFDCGPPFEVEAELAKESDCRFQVIDDNAYVVHPLKRHVCPIHKVAITLTTDRGATVQKPSQGGAFTSAPSGFADERPTASLAGCFALNAGGVKYRGLESGRTSSVTS
jgi:hypothetical protein